MVSSALTALPDVEPLRKAARAFVSAMSDLGSKYLALVATIREGQYRPEVVDRVLSEAGLPRPRISELRRVAECSEEIYEDFKARLIGFKAALAKAREASTDSPEAQREIANKRKWAHLAVAIDKLWAKTGKPAQPCYWLNGHGILFIDQKSLVDGSSFRLGKYTVHVEAGRKKQTKARKAKHKTK